MFTYVTCAMDWESFVFGLAISHLHSHWFLSTDIFCWMIYPSYMRVIQDPKFWIYRPFSEQMVRAAADDVRFLLYIYHKMMGKLSQRSLWYLAVRGALYCRCFCTNDNDYADWPSLPPIPGLLTWMSHHNIFSYISGQLLN